MKVYPDISMKQYAGIQCFLTMGFYLIFSA